MQDKVNDLQDNNNGEDFDRDDTLSRVSRVSKYSNLAKSELSRISNKTYIMHLKSELDEEKQARLKLERELEELRKLSSEISSHLGLKK